MLLQRTIRVLDFRVHGHLFYRIQKSHISKLNTAKIISVLSPRETVMINILSLTGKHCHRLDVLPRNWYVEILTPEVRVFEGGPFGRS